MAHYFIADVHLSADNPEINSAFFRTLSALENVEALYICGDLFDAYLGDDFMTDFQLEIGKFLKDLAFPIYFQHGNRDFLLGDKFVKISGIKLLPERFILNLAGKKILLEHGDLLCTADKSYQIFRKISRNSLILWLYKNLSLNLKKRLIKNLRQQSKSKNQFISDAQDDEINKIAKKYNIDYLIHGHTHRPNVHNYAWGKRFVLSDWKPDAELLAFANGKFFWQASK